MPPAVPASSSAQRLPGSPPGKMCVCVCVCVCGRGRGGGRRQGGKKARRRKEGLGVRYRCMCKIISNYMYLDMCYQSLLSPFGKWVDVKAWFPL